MLSPKDSVVPATDIPLKSIELKSKFTGAPQLSFEMKDGDGNTAGLVYVASPMTKLEKDAIHAAGMAGYQAAAEAASKAYLTRAYSLKF